MHFLSQETVFLLKQVNILEELPIKHIILFSLESTQLIQFNENRAHLVIHTVNISFDFLYYNYHQYRTELPSFCASHTYYPFNINII